MKKVRFKIDPRTRFDIPIMHPNLIRSESHRIDVYGILWIDTKLVTKVTQDNSEQK